MGVKEGKKPTCAWCVCACVLCKAADRRLPSWRDRQAHPASPGSGAWPCHPSGTSCLWCSKIGRAQMRLTCSHIQLPYSMTLDPVRDQLLQPPWVWREAHARLGFLPGHLPPAGSPAACSLFSFSTLSINRSHSAHPRGTGGLKVLNLTQQCLEHLPSLLTVLIVWLQRFLVPAPAPTQPYGDMSIQCPSTDNG